MGDRKIIHIDMDAFYASIEQRDDPELRGKPIAVGGDGKRGVVAAASYEARKFGVFSAMSSKIAKQKCPELIFVRHRFPVYKEVSRQIHEVFQEYTDLIEPLSLDEAYLDVTENKLNILSARQIAAEIKEKIKQRTNLTASAGVSFNKFLAKIASDLEKPDGLTVVTREKAEALIKSLAIEKFHGIGKVTAAKMKKHQIFKGEQLLQLGEAELVRMFGKAGRYYHRMVRLEDHRPVNPSREHKSISAENTFEDDLFNKEDMLKELERITEVLLQRMEKNKLKGKTLVLKIRLNDFSIKTRSKTKSNYFSLKAEIMEVLKELLYDFDLSDKGVRLLGVGMSKLNVQEKRKEKNNGQTELEF